MSLPKVVVPISALGTISDGWIIRARVIHKSSLHTPKDLCMFSVELRDQNAEINAKVMSSLCDQWMIFYDTIQIHKVYFFTGGELTPANRKYTSAKNENELLFTNETTVTLCCEATPEIPTLPFFTFVEVGRLQVSPTDTAIDIIGIGKCSDELDKKYPPSCAGRNERTIWIMDRTACAQLTLYGDQVEKFKGTHPTVVAVKGAKIAGGDERFLQMGRWGHILVNPDLPETYSLLEWWSTDSHASFIKSE
uniref:Putative replication factor-a protein 1 n=1 Tax=Ixodes ricinus TaxID=34613 RepID=V5GPC2_IXORI